MKKKIALFLLIALITRLSPITITAQNHRVIPDNREMPHEFLDQPYLPNAYNNQKTTPAMKYRGTRVVTTQVNVNANQQNIVGDAANEPNIAIDPRNPNNIVIGWRQFDAVQSNFRQAGYAYTSDGGQTWTFPGVINPGIFRSDPVLDYDTSGVFYYNSLTDSYLCKVFKSIDGGAVWDTGVNAQGGDKQWMAIDRTKGVGSGNIYAWWNSVYSTCQPGFFTRSTNHGSSFEDCTIVGGYPYWGTMAVGNAGELFIGGTTNSFNGIAVAESQNAQIPGSSIAWDMFSEVDMDGYISGNSQINPVGILGQVNIDIDRSNGPGRGNVYVAAAMIRISTFDPGDVMFARSKNGGISWSNPVRINDDPGTSNTQWLAVMSVAPTGRIDVAWLDTRDAPAGTDMSALYYSYSVDQGNTWSVNEKLSDSFDPHVGYPQQDKMGDYIDMISDSLGAHLAWANTLNGEEDVYYSHIIPPITGIVDLKAKDTYCSLSCYPNPFHSNTMIRYQIPEESPVRVVISDVYGQEISTLVSKNQLAGIYNLDFSAENLPAGYYICKLTSGTHSATTRLIVLQ